MEKKMFITLVRHMETDWNAEDRYTAQVFHIRLNQVGIDQAEKMADLLEKVPFQLVVSSDQIRAIETAVILARRHQRIIRFKTDQRLREVNVGSIMGKQKHEVTEPKFLTKNPLFDYGEIGGENKAAVIRRQRDFLDETKATEGDIEVLVVGHGTSLRILLEDLGIPEILTRENFIRFEY